MGNLRLDTAILPGNMRILLYSHDGLGLGHTRRHLAVAAALSELDPEASILVASGADEVNRLGLPARVEVLKLPSLRKVGNEQYASRRLRIPVAEIRRLRSALLQAAVSTFRPTVVLVDKHPFGAGGEFHAALDTVRGYGGACVLGLRDILDEPATVLREWAGHDLQERIAEYYDRVLIYGERGIFDPVREYEFPEAIARRTSFCGYVVNREGTERPPRPIPPGGHPPQRAHSVVLATAGGGEDGYLMLQSFIRAAVGADWQGIVIPGPMTPEAELESLRRSAFEAEVGFQAFIPNLSALFWTINALVCMGGYNTLVEAVSKGMPTVCVPRTTPRAEQLLRAAAFERLGLLRMIRPEQLSPERLRQGIERALGISRPELLERASAHLRFDGARQAATQLLALAGRRRVDRSLESLAREHIAEAI